MVNIKIPATSANIGSGFDSLGLALSLYNYVFIDEHDGMSITSMDGSDFPIDGENLVYRTAKKLYELCGRRFYGLKILQQNNIPMTRGLGSSSACIVAGLVGANELMGRPMSNDDIVDLAATEEGHPDNSTPALLGGLVTAVLEDGHVYRVKQEIQVDLSFVAIIPDFELKTSYARSVLPRQIAHGDGVFNLSRSALMSVSLYSGSYGNLKVAAQDRMHQPFRYELIPNSRDVIDAGYEFGAYAVYISGGGPSLMAIVARENGQFERRMRLHLDKLGLMAWQIKSLRIDNSGASLF